VAATRRLAAIVFTDIAGYTTLTQADEGGALRLVQEQEKLVRPLLEAHRGRKVKSMGDGLLLEFPNALDAVEWAVDLQRHVHERNAREGVPPFRIRVGIHLGDVERRGTDIFGDAVNIASRVEPIAEPGGVCLSAQVYDQVHNKVPYQIETLGPQRLKGVRDPVEIYRVVLPWGAGTPAPGPVVPRLAILPFANISPDPKDEYFADGLTEELISVLSQIRGLRVISRTSVNQYRGTSKQIAQIGSELGVDSVLEGSVRKAGDLLRIAVQLIDVRTDEHRWSQTYDRKLENVFAIQADVAERTAGALKVELVRSEQDAIRERPTSSLAAYESYLRGIQAFRLYEGFGSEETDQSAEKYFEAALREDPQFSAAYSYLANHLLAAMGLTRAGREVFPRARELVAEALKLNPTSSDTHTAIGNLAMQADQDWVRAETEFREAIELNPSSSTAHFWYGYLLSTLQRFDEARAQYHLAIEVDPLWLLPRLNMISILCSVGDYESAIALTKKLSTDFGDRRPVVMLLLQVYLNAGRRDDAIAALERLPGPLDVSARTTRAAVLALLGQPEEARAMLAEWEGGRWKGYVSLVGPAQFYALWGESDKAIALLEQDYRDGDKVLWASYQTSFFDPIRDDPRFVACLRRMNLPTTLPRRLTTGSGRKKSQNP
jgi:adenylate cyclase